MTYKVEIDNSSKKQEIALALNETTYLILAMRYKELFSGKSGSGGDDVPYDIDGYLTTIDTGKIDSDYMNSRFEKFFKLLQTKGVDAGAVETNITDLAKNLATKLNVVGVITGVEDIVSDGKDTYVIKNGCSTMGDIVGTGCMSSSIVGTFCAIEKDYALACVSALVCFEICAELANKESCGLGDFKVKLFDKVLSLNETIINEKKNFMLV